jgi:polar amino acid transport system substrate-binding protein
VYERENEGVVIDIQQVPDPRIADLRRAGKIRVALYPPQYAKDLATGELRGWTIELARALAARIGVEFMPIEYQTPPRAMEGLKAGACDMGFGAMDESRISEMDSHPRSFNLILPIGDGRLLNSKAADADCPSTRIAVVRNHASTLCLNRVRKHAELISAETPDLAFDLLRSGDAWASTRPALLEFSARLSGSRVLDDCFGANFTAMAVPQEQSGRLAYISEFIEEAKASGLVQRAINDSGWRGVRVAAKGKGA